MAYKRARNLRDILCHSQLPRPVKNHSSRPCMRFNCNHCENIISDKEIVSTSTGHKHKIIGNNTCQTRNVVYAITCPVCRSQYVGETGRHLWERLADHKRDIRNRKRDSPVSEHFRDHDAQANEILCTVLDSSPSNKNIRKRLEEAWIRILSTMNPAGMNQIL